MDSGGLTPETLVGSCRPSAPQFPIETSDWQSSLLSTAKWKTGICVISEKVGNHNFEVNVKYLVFKAQVIQNAFEL